MIKIILFDLGNVILPFDVMRLVERLSRYSPLSPREIVKNLWSSRIAEQFETGQITSSEYFSHVKDQCQLSGISYEEFIPLFNNIFEEDEDVVGLVERLKNNYSLGIISNTNPLHLSHVRKAFSCLSYFDHQLYSNEARVRKPNAEIYNMALDRFSINPRETVFIDDIRENVSAATDLGMNGIHYQGYPQLTSDLNKMGVIH